MRRTTNSEQPSPSRRSKRPRKANEHLSGYVIGMSRKGKCGKEYTACKNLMKSFNECEARGNDAQVSGDTAAQIAARDITKDSNGAVISRDVQENDQNEDEEQTKRIRVQHPHAFLRHERFAFT